MSDLERITTWRPAFDKRSPDPNKNYGVHGMELRFVLKGPKGATQFLLYTNWHLQHVQESFDRRLDRDFPHLSCHPQPADIGYHALTPQYEGQTSLGPCDVLDGHECFYDGSSLNAEPIYWRFVAEGEESVWRRLEEDYHDRFDKESA